MASWASLEEALTVGYGIERAFVCPVHGSDNAHASVNSLTGWWFCYSCKAKGHVDMDRLDIDPFNVQKQIEQTMARMNPVHEHYPETYLNLFDATGPGKYWLSRFTKEVCLRHRLGQSPDGSFATIPMRDSMGRVLGVIKRDLTGADEVKYRYPSGLTISDYLYNYEDCYEDDVILLTEGATDVIAANEAGWECAMAAYGSTLSRAQTDLIRKYDPTKVIVAFDQDKAGDSGFARVYDRLHRDFPVIRMRWSGYKDLASIPLTQRAEALHKVTSTVRTITLYKVGQSRVGSST